MRQGKNYMVIVARNQLPHARLHPFFLLATATVWAMSVAATVVLHLFVFTIGAVAAV
jgi:hypothetical protein